MGMNKVSNIIKKLIPERYHKSVADWKNLYFDGYTTKSYFQEGEDMILRRIFEKRTTGFYVDVGAHHRHDSQILVTSIRRDGEASILMPCREA